MLAEGIMTWESSDGIKGREKFKVVVVIGNGTRQFPDIIKWDEDGFDDLIVLTRNALNDYCNEKDPRYRGTYIYKDGDNFAYLLGTYIYEDQEGQFKIRIDFID